MSAPNDTPGPVPITNAKERSGFSFVWLIPIFALLAAVGVAWQNYASQGPLIEITFSQADGVRPGETEVRYRDIPVGVVEEITFADDLDRVVAMVRLDKDLAPYVDDGASFWIVRPEVTAQGVSGLDTVLSGVYIVGRWDGVQGAPQSQFTGLEEAPLLVLGEEGVVFNMRSTFELPAEGTPILYRGVQVGRMGRPELSEDGLVTVAQAVILAPFDRLVTSATRFWDISGFNFSVGAQGAQLDVSSLASLVAGGVSFETLASGGTPIQNGQSFRLHPDEESAREDFFLEGDGGSVTLMMVFEENLPGLQAGAAVSLGGLRLGEVATISGIVDPERFGDSEVRLVTTVRVNPDRLGLAVDFFDFLEARVASGLRGRLVSGSLLTGGLRIELVEIENAAPASFDRTADPFPAIPTAPANVTNVTASAQGLITRVEALPVEELLEQAIGFLADVRGVIGSEALQEAPETLLSTLEAVEALVASPEISGLPNQIGVLADELSTSADSLSRILVQVEDAEVVAELGTLVASLNRTADRLPGIAAQTSELLQKAEDLPLEALVGDLSGAARSAGALIADEALAGLPDQLATLTTGLTGTVEQAREVISDIQQAGIAAQITGVVGELDGIAEGASAAVGRVNMLLQDVQQAQVLDDVSAVLAAFQQTAERLPGLADQASAVLDQAEALSLDALAEDTRALIQSIDTLVSQDSTRQMPDTLNASLTELQATLAELRQGGVVENANATLAAARDAAEAIAQASGTLPALANRLSTAASQAEETLSAYDRSSEFGREISSAIRQIEATAGAIDRLARQIARNPNSLITGR